MRAVDWWQSEESRRPLPYTRGAMCRFLMPFLAKLVFPNQEPALSVHTVPAFPHEFCLA